MKQKQKVRRNDFEFLWQELKRRFTHPLKTFAFWVELVGVVIVVGALGVWLSMGLFGSKFYSDLNGVGSSLFTYFPSVIAPALFQMIFFTKENSERALAFILAIIALVAFGLSVSNSGYCRILWSLGGVTISLFTWWFANALKDYDVSQNPELDSGAGPAPEKTAPAGTGRGFKGVAKRPTPDISQNSTDENKINTKSGTIQ